MFQVVNIMLKPKMHNDVKMQMWNNEDQICEVGKLNRPSERVGILSSVVDTGTELLISKGIPFLAKKGLDTGRYYASEFMRDPKLQKRQ